MMRVRLAFGVCVLLFLGGCAVASKQAVFPRHYTLTGAARPAPTASAGQVNHDSLRVARIVSPPWLQGAGIYYRLEYRHDHSIASYADSDWVAPPAQMLEQIIQSALAAGGGWRVVVGPGSPARTDFSLEIRLDDFSQAFTNYARSRGVIDATATLIDNRDERVLAQRRFRVEAEAPSADAAGGVRALNDASRQFATQIQDWLRESAPRGSSADGTARPR